MRLFEIRCPAAEAELVADACWLHGGQGVWERAHGDDEVVLVVGVAEGDAEGWRRALADRAPRDVTEADAVVLATREVAVGDDVFVVPPTVFGDGRHPTTLACLDAIGALVGPGSSVLDVGCGTGVLSMAAAGLGATVRAIDVDPVAVDATRTNAERAGRSVDADTAPLSSIEDRYDVVVANIAAGALCTMAADLRRVCAPDGRLVVSGILVERWPEVRSALGGDVIGETARDGWVTATVRFDRR